LRRHTGEITVDYFSTVRVLSFDVGEVGRPHHAIDPDDIPQPNADRVLLKPPQNVFLDVIGRLSWKRPPALETLRPVASFLISCVRAAVGKWQPTHPCFGKKDLQIRKPLEDAVERHLHGVEETGLAKSCRLECKIQLVDRKTAVRVV